MTVKLGPQTEIWLREKAQREGSDVDTLADTLLADILEHEAHEQAKTIAAIQEGLDAVAAGRTKPLEQYIAEQRAKRGLPDSWPASAVISESTPGVVVASE